MIFDSCPTMKRKEERKSISYRTFLARVDASVWVSGVVKLKETFHHILYSSGIPLREFRKPHSSILWKSSQAPQDQTISWINGEPSRQQASCHKEMAERSCCMARCISINWRHSSDPCSSSFHPRLQFECHDRGMQPQRHEKTWTDTIIITVCEKQDP